MAGFIVTPTGHVRNDGYGIYCLICWRARYATRRARRQHTGVRNITRQPGNISMSHGVGASRFTLFNIGGVARRGAVLPLFFTAPGGSRASQKTERRIKALLAATTPCYQTLVIHICHDDINGVVY